MQKFVHGEGNWLKMKDLLYLIYQIFLINHSSFKRLANNPIIAYFSNSYLLYPFKTSDYNPSSENTISLFSSFFINV